MHRDESLSSNVPSERGRICELAQFWSGNHMCSLRNLPISPAILRLIVNILVFQPTTQRLDR